MVAHIENDGVVYTEQNSDRAYCEVIDPSNGPKYVRTKPDSTTGSNLLSLPRR